MRLLENARTKEYKVSALNSPFDSKEVLKARGYRWNPDNKTWATSVAVPLLEKEVEWLKDEVYGKRTFQLELEKQDAFNRFSARKGDVAVVKFS